MTPRILQPPAIYVSTSVQTATIIMETHQSMKQRDKLSPKFNQPKILNLFTHPNELFRLNRNTLFSVSGVIYRLWVDCCFLAIPCLSVHVTSYFHLNIIIYQKSLLYVFLLLFYSKINKLNYAETLSVV